MRLKERKKETKIKSHLLLFYLKRHQDENFGIQNRKNWIIRFQKKPVLRLRRQLFLLCL